MHNFEQVSDVLQHLRDCHQRLADFYRDTAKEVLDEPAAMLLNTLSGHESKMADELTAYQGDASSTVLNTFFQYSEIASFDTLLKFEKRPQEFDTNEVYKLSMGVDNYLSEFFDKMIERSEIVEVRALFENLRAEVEEEKKRLSLDMTGLLDM